MHNKTNPHSVSTALRKRAEEIARARATLPPATREEMEQAIYELQVHQVELELQNEDLRRTQTNLNASRTRYFDLYNLAPVGYVTVSRQGIILEANLTLADLLGVRRGALAKQKLSNFILPEDQDTYYFFSKQLVETGEQQVCEVRMRAPDGKLLWGQLETSATQRQIDASAFYIVIRDITDRKTTEDQLFQAMREQQLILDTVNVGITKIADRKLVWVNKKVEDLLQYSKEEMEGMPTRKLYPSEEIYEQLGQEAYPVLAQGHIYDVELQLMRRDGSGIWIRYNGKAIEPSDLSRGTIWTLEDITERKQGEEALRKSEAAVRKKLQVILDPEGDIGTLELADIIDVPALQTMMEHFNRITKLVFAIVDNRGQVLVGVGWQDICTKFHRMHPKTLKNCQESDTVLSKGVPTGTFKAYHCTNNLWDIATPIVIGDRHMGNVFLGQFFYDDETIDHELFKRQAHQYGFNEQEYLAALDRVPRQSRETVEATMAFYGSLSQMISSLSYSTVKLARALFQKDAAFHQLDESEAFQISLLETIPIPVFYKDVKGRYLGCNKAFEDFYGKTKEYIIGKSVADVYPPELAQIYSIKDAELFEKKGFQVYESMIQDAHGVRRDVILHKASLVDSHGEIIGLIGAIIDITERKQAEEENAKLGAQLQQAQKMESVALLAGGVAHDFNNMLGVILGHAEMAMEKVDPALPILDDLKKIHMAAQRSADITRQLLTFARKQNVDPRVLDINETIEGMLKMLRRLIGENINLLWMPLSGLWPIKADPSQIDQILANLCVNARDAIAGVGKIIVETANCTFDESSCAAHADLMPGDYVRIAVSDNGCGMDKQTIAHIFEPFFTTKDVGVGTGLGLATVYGAVKQNNGFINVDSEPGQGTVFAIYLPRYVGTDGQVQADNTMEPAVRGDETILLVEDEPTILGMTTMMLRRLGYTVLTASTPREAIRLASEHGGEIHLLATDLIMPEMNGRDLSERLLASHPTVKCLFISGYTADIIANQGVLHEGVSFIQKPFSQRNLATKVREALERQ